MKAATKVVPPTVRPRIELAQVPRDWPAAHWGAPHHVDSNAPTSEYWVFELENGAIVTLEHMPVYESVLVFSDCPDTELLRTELDVRTLLSGDFRHALKSGEVEELAAECRRAGKSMDEAFSAFEGRGADPVAILESVRAAYGASPDEARRVFAGHYRSSFELRPPPLRRG